jgi:non-homologous end joining protein Ku
MAPRAYWNGSLKLSLVTCPISLYPASTQAEKTHFHQINTKTGHRLKQQMVDEQTWSRRRQRIQGQGDMSSREADTPRSTNRSSKL